MNALPRNYNPGRPHQWTFAQLDTMLEWLGEQIAATRAQLPGIWTDVIDWSPSSLPSSGDVKVSGGDRSDDGKKRSPSAEMAVRAMSSGCDPLVAAMNTVSQIVAAKEALSGGSRPESSNRPRVALIGLRGPAVHDAAAPVSIPFAASSVKTWWWCHEH